MPDRLGDRIRLLHILDAITEIEDYIKDTDIEGFVNNSMMLTPRSASWKLSAKQATGYHRICFTGAVISRGQDYRFAQPGYP